ncbi:hypothetical protein K491DRAFT_553154, partial [Lophiostoma macrostomum CBS 122681]
LPSLLETGSTALIRNTAADQLADVQKQHPDELFNLLTRVIPYLRSKNWDTRVAAAKAVGGIVANAEKFDPNAEDEPFKAEFKSETNGHAKSEAANGSAVKDEENGDPVVPSNDDQLDLGTLDLSSILKYGKTLLGSAGKEYDFKLAAMEPSERLAHQKKSLTARLGLGGKYMEDDLVTENDFVAQTPGIRTPAVQRIDTTVSRSDSITSAMGASPPPAGTPTADSQSGLSKRQLNMLKRKAKKDIHNRANKVQIVDLGPRR